MLANVQVEAQLWLTSFFTSLDSRVIFVHFLRTPKTQVKDKFDIYVAFFCRNLATVVPQRGSSIRICRQIPGKIFFSLYKNNRIEHLILQKTT